MLKFISVSSIQFLTFYNKISDHVELGPTLVLVLGKNYTVIQFAWSYSGTWTKSRDCCEWDPSEGSDLGGSAEVLFLIDFSCFRRSRVNSSSEQDHFRKYEIDVNEKMINKIGSVSDNKWFFKLVSHMGRYCMASLDN